MKNRGEQIQNGKLRGEWAEMYFMTCAAEHGLQVNKPWGEMAPFDFVIGDRGCLLRVQVKSTLSRRGTGYVCTVVRGLRRRYAGDAVDFFAILVVPELAWYIIPAKLILGMAWVALFPNSPKSKYAPYKEAWHLLRPRPCACRGTIDCIQACADPTLYFEGTAPCTAQAGECGELAAG